MWFVTVADLHIFPAGNNYRHPRISEIVAKMHPKTIDRITHLNGLQATKQFFNTKNSLLHCYWRYILGCPLHVWKLKTSLTSKLKFQPCMHSNFGTRHNFVWLSDSSEDHQSGTILWDLEKGQKGDSKGVCLLHDHGILWNTPEQKNILRPGLSR